jgi:serine protease inhibitor
MPSPLGLQRPDGMIQDATVEVDEHGTVAAAATAVEVSHATGIAESIPVVIDRPFLFFVRDANTTRRVCCSWGASKTRRSN